MRISDWSSDVCSSDLLGLDEAALARHIAWDIGIAEVTRHLARRLDAPAVLSRFSRLIVDPNRQLDNPTLIPEISDGTVDRKSVVEGKSVTVRVDIGVRGIFKKTTKKTTKQNYLYT